MRTERVSTVVLNRKRYKNVHFEGNFLLGAISRDGGGSVFSDILWYKQTDKNPVLL